MNASVVEADVVREAVGSFVDAEKVHAAIDELLASGFKHEELRSARRLQPPERLS